MGMEKGYGHWKGDFITELNPIRPGWSASLKWTKNFPAKRACKLKSSPETANSGLF
jgi:hypothetical protein